MPSTNTKTCFDQDAKQHIHDVSSKAFDILRKLREDLEDQIKATFKDLCDEQVTSTYHRREAMHRLGAMMQSLASISDAQDLLAVAKSPNR